jgi:glycolate oxidase FAD binding subunit
MERLQPRDAAEACDAVAALAAHARPCEIIGHGSRRRLGGRAQADVLLDLGGLRGVVLYEPSELVLTAQAATPLADLKALLAEQRQHLAFEPPDYGPLWGQAAGLGTVGGAISVGHGGSRRPFAGAPRDHLLGFKAISATGEPFAAGGRVVKNVTGFDLPKLMTGAFGTLGVLTELTLKVLPAPEASCTLAFQGMADEAGLALLRQAAACAVPIAGAAHLPADAGGWPAPLQAFAGASLTMVRLEGLEAVLPLMAERLRQALGAAGAGCEILDGAATADIWPALGGAALFAGSEAPVWRVALPPSQATAVGADLRAAGFRLYYEWAGRLLWAECPAEAELGGGDLIRDALSRLAGEGHATLVRGDEALSRRIAPFQPQSPGAARLAARLKAQFDPHDLFNPGRMDGAF